MFRVRPTAIRPAAAFGTPDMTPSGIAAEAKAAHLPATIKLPTCAVAGLAVNNGSRARCFADYMRIHAYEASGGTPYALMPRYATQDGKANGRSTTPPATSGRPRPRCRRP
jgi:hypothetical protein